MKSGRAFQYALRAVKLYQHLQRQKDGAAWVLGKQYLRAACSIGANMEESQSGESRADLFTSLALLRRKLVKAFIGFDYRRSGIVKE